MLSQVDTLNPIQRSAVMARVRGRDTQPELRVRRLLHRMGYRYRLHSKNLPGKPDLVFSSRRKVVFVHGCFWHRHRNCVLARLPKSRKNFWLPKLEGNRLRDARRLRELRKLGWTPMVVWECQLRNTKALARRLTAFLGGRK
jgi:DNA mismatch endonuclease, patch repair protein